MSNRTLHFPIRSRIRNAWNALFPSQPKATAHRGASYDRLYSDFVSSAGSADTDNLFELPELRQRCRLLVRNDGYAKSALMTLISHVVGTGFKPQAVLDRDELNLNEDAADKLIRKMERIYQDWAEHADITNHLDADGLQNLFYRAKVQDGEGLALVRMKIRPRVRYRLCLQLIEADRLSTPTYPTLTNNNRGGVEIGPDGDPLFYHIRKTHPGDYSFATTIVDASGFEKIPAYNEFGWPLVLHHFSIDRPGQSRGIPLFGPVIALFKDLMDYREAEITAARAAACYMMFVKKTGNPLTGAINASMIPGMETPTTDQNGYRLQGFEPGMIGYLGENEDVTPFSPNRPSNTFDPFIRSCLRIIAAATGQTYEQVSHDLSQVNYSSIRAGNLESKRFYMMEQAGLIRSFPKPVWGMLMEEAYTLGDLEARDFLIRRDQWTRSKWDSKLGEDWVDPLKEILAIEKAIDLNLTTKAKECALRGEDWTINAYQRAREVALENELGIVPPEKNANAIKAVATTEPTEPTNPVKPDDSEDANNGA